MKKIVAIIALIILIGGGVLIYMKKSNKQKQVLVQTQNVEKVKIAVPSEDLTMNFAINYARNYGFFSKEGVDVEVVSVDAQPFQAVAAGQVDAMFGGLARPVNVYFNGVDSRLLFTAFNTFDAYLVSRYDVDHSSEIKKVVVNTPGGEQYQMLDNGLSNLGLDPAKIEHVTIPNAQGRLAAFDRGDVDAMLVTDRKEYDDNEDMHKYFLLDPSLVTKNANFAKVVITTQQAIDKNGSGLQKFTSAMYLSLMDMRDNKAAFIEYSKTTLGFTDEQASNFYDQFISAFDQVSFVPQINSALQSVADQNKKDTTDPQRDFSAFIYPKFANIAVSSK